MGRFVRGRALLLLGLLGCEPSLDGLCLQTGCDGGGARLSIRRVHPRQHAIYLFEVSTEASTYSWPCEIVDGAWCAESSHAPEDDDVVEVVMFEPGDDGDMQLWIFGGQDMWFTGPAWFTLRITEGDRVVLEQTVTPSYSRFEQPYGPECGGCEYWSGEVELVEPPSRTHSDT